MTANLVFVDMEKSSTMNFDRFGIRFFYKQVDKGVRFVVSVRDLYPRQRSTMDSNSVILSLNTDGIYMNPNSVHELNDILCQKGVLVDDASDTDSEGGCLCYDEDGEEINYATWEDMPGLRG